MATISRACLNCGKTGTDLLCKDCETGVTPIKEDAPTTEDVTAKTEQIEEVEPKTLAELVSDEEEARQLYLDLMEQESEIIKQRKQALEMLNEAQAALDAFMANRKRTAPGGTEWNKS